MNKTIGICLGAWSISFVHIEAENSKINITKTQKLIHNGNPQIILTDYLKNLTSENNKISENIKIVATGRKFRNFVNFTNIPETEAAEYALNYIINKYEKQEKYSALASLGAETFLVYNLAQSKYIANVVSKNKCASGTGEFFLQQIKRMDLSLDDAVKIAENVEPYKVSGRCSVFCKSDCTHALNKGVDKSKVTAGLAKMIAEKIEELIREKNDGKIILVGGVTKNKVVMDFIKQNNHNIFIPEESEYFEALGAALYACNSLNDNTFAIVNNAANNFLSVKNSDIIKNDFAKNNFLEKNNFEKNIDLENLFKNTPSSFSFQKPLKQFEGKVTFKATSKRKAEQNEECILGLDVGSTTTKAVIISKETNDILSSVYLYTNGNPIKAAKQCYQTLLEDLLVENLSIKIVGIGTTGSGRQIAGLHCLTSGIFNEITAHSTAAIFYDSEVETIFEIGGQDAKYTYIVNKVPADYAMNEACSAGTGSFIEEAAFESLGVKVAEIEQLALTSENPPNFSDQCSAFISSDIKTAQQEGISKNDIIAGLVYSICHNYLNRVKGNRPVGKKIFMQGGVCYNKAIPIAMAAISGTEIIVPPEPGLMGAFGVALEVKEKQQLGLLEVGDFSLQELIEREVVHHKGFICAGGNSATSKCDLKCNIAVVEIASKKFPFGGACERYNNQNNNYHQNYNNQNYNNQNYNYRNSQSSKNFADNLEKYDLVKLRNDLLFRKYTNV